MKLTVTATDGDGDTVTDSAQVLLADENSNNENAAITFDDDGPTVTAESTCDEVPPIPGKDANFVLVLDSSGSVDGSQLALIKANAINFLNDARSVRRRERPDPHRRLRRQFARGRHLRPHH